MVKRLDIALLAVSCTLNVQPAKSIVFRIAYVVELLL